MNIPSVMVAYRILVNLVFGCGCTPCICLILHSLPGLGFYC